MSEDITLTLKNRTVLGKGLNQLRRDGQIPAVIHDHGQASVHVMAPYMEVYKVWQQVGKHHPVNLTVGGKQYLAIIRDADFEPRKNSLRHVVFNAIKQDEKVETEVPVVFQGDAEAEKASLMVLRQIETVEVEALPKDLPSELIVDISGLTEIGDRLHVSDIVVPPNVTLLTEPEHAVAVVEEPRAHAAAEAEEAAEAAEGEAAEGTEGETAAPDADTTATDAQDK